MKRRFSLSILTLGLLVLLFGLWVLPQNVISKESDEKVRSFLGVSVKEVEKKIRKKFELERKEGVQITHVYEDSPADFADLEYNDIILEIDGSKIKSSSHLTRVIRKHKPGDKISLRVIHDGKEKNVRVELSEYDKEDDSNLISFFRGSPNVLAYSFGDKPYLGVYLQQLNKDLAAYFKVDKEDGVLITEVEEDSPAEVAGVKPGDILTKIDNESVESPDDAMEIIGEFEPEEEVKITIIRSGKEKTMTVELDESTSSSFRSSKIFVSPRSKNFKIHVPEIDNVRRIRELIEFKIQDDINDRIHGIMEHQIRNLDRQQIIIEERNRDKNRLLQRMDKYKDRMHNKLKAIKEDIKKVVSTEPGVRTGQITSN